MSAASTSRGAPGRARLRGDRGVAGAWEILPIGVLVFVVGSLLVTNAWAVVDAKMAAAAAAREASRAYVEAPPTPAEALRRAQTAAARSIAGHGRDPDRLELRGPSADADYVRCAPATFTATYPVPAISLPWIGGFGSSFTVSASHTEIVDPFRAGIPGSAGCA